MRRSPSFLSHLLVPSLLGSEALARRPDSRDSAQALPGVTVSATRSPSRILTTPLAVTKIETPELRSVNGFGLDDALSRIPGVVAQSRYGTSDIRLMIRGFGARGAGDRSNSGTSRGVRVLVEGFPETEPDGRTAFDQLDLAATAGLEVIRSNASALWGERGGRRRKGHHHAGGRNPGIRGTDHRRWPRAHALCGANVRADGRERRFVVSVSLGI